jgi:hypothetical protein
MDDNYGFGFQETMVGGHRVAGRKTAVLDVHDGYFGGE